MRIKAVAFLLLMVMACGKKAAHSDTPPNAPQPPSPAVPFKATDFPNVTNSLFGAWSSDTAEFGSNLAFFQTLYFNNQGQMGVKRTCVGSRDEISAALSIPMVLSTNSIEISAEVDFTTQSERIAQCTVSVSPDRFIFAVQGDRLSLTNRKNEIKYFTRVLSGD